jgi:hypothetical protein
MRKFFLSERAFYATMAVIVTLVILTGCIDIIF